MRGRDVARHGGTVTGSHGKVVIHMAEASEPQGCQGTHVEVYEGGGEYVYDGCLLCFAIAMLEERYPHLLPHEMEITYVMVDDTLTGVVR